MGSKARDGAKRGVFTPIYSIDVTDGKCDIPRVGKSPLRAFPSALYHAVR